MPKDTLERLDAARGDDSRSEWILRLIARELDAPAAAVPSTASLVAAANLALGAAEPSPGVVCAAPRCRERKNTRYGLRRVPLRPADAAALRGETYRRDLPVGTARVVRRATTA